MMLLDLDHRVIADTLHPGAPPRPFPLAGLAPREGDETRGRASGLVVLDGARPYQVAVLPVMAPDLIGHVVIGFPVDTAFARLLKSTTGLEVSFATSRDDRRWEVFASTLPPPRAERLAEALPGKDMEDADGSFDSTARASWGIASCSMPAPGRRSRRSCIARSQRRPSPSTSCAWRS